ncbi:MAG: hypothetical protein Kow0069_20170 [Promethearchaeota archaeon]
MVAFPVHALGGLVTVVGIVANTSVAFLLPFKAYRLVVLDSRSGTMAFNHAWESGNLDDSLLSNLIQALAIFAGESLQNGNFRELHSEEAVLIMEWGKGLEAAFALVATRVSKSLRTALRGFAREFEARFVGWFDHPAHVAAFSGAREIVDRHFSFVPKD